MHLVANRSSGFDGPTTVERIAGQCQIPLKCSSSARMFWIQFFFSLPRHRSQGLYTTTETHARITYNSCLVRITRTTRVSRVDGQSLSLVVPIQYRILFSQSILRSAFIDRTRAGHDDLHVSVFIAAPAAPSRKYNNNNVRGLPFVVIVLVKVLVHAKPSKSRSYTMSDRSHAVYGRGEFDPFPRDVYTGVK